MYDKLHALSLKVDSFKDVVTNESQTRSVLIEPFINLLGYDTSNPFDVVAEYTCDVGTKKGEKVDYALKKENDIAILVEAKDSKVRLTEKNIGQLFRYFSVSSAKVALLTNGLDYWFFTDTTKNNVMDTTPFFTFNMLGVDEKISETLSLFHKDNIDLRSISNYAISSSFSNAFKDYFEKQSLSPTHDFVSFLTKNLGVTNINSKDAILLVGSELKKMLRGSNSVESKNHLVSDDLVASSSLDLDTTSIETVEKRKRKHSSKEGRITGTYLLSDLDASNCIHTKPSNIMLNDCEYTVGYWYSVLFSLFDYANKKEKLNFVLDSLKNADIKWLFYDKQDKGAVKEVYPFGFFVNTGVSSPDMVTRVKYLCSLLELEQDSVIVELV